MAAYYKDLWDYVALLCHLPEWQANGTYDFTSRVNDAKIIQKAFNEAIEKIAKEKYAPVLLDGISVSVKNSDYLEINFVEKMFKILEVRVNDIPINFKYEMYMNRIDFDTEYPAGTEFHYDFKFIPADIPLKYDSSDTIKNRFPDNIVDINIICYYAASAWYKWQGGEDDLKMAATYYNDWLEGLNKIYSPIDESETIKNVYGGGIW